MVEVLKGNLHNLVDGKIQGYLGLLLEAYESESRRVCVLHYDTEKVTMCEVLVELKYMIDINPLSSFFKDDSYHEYLLTKEGKKIVEMAFPEKIKKTEGESE